VTQDKIQTSALFPPSKSAGDGVCDNFASGKTDAYLIHVGEGTDAPARAEFAKLARKAKKLADDGVEGPKRPKPDPNRKVVVPKQLAALLAKNAKARATFEGFPYSKKNEYVTWINGAKREETRDNRLATTVAQLAEGKSLMWKYEGAK